MGGRFACLRGPKAAATLAASMLAAVGSSPLAPGFAAVVADAAAPDERLLLHNAKAPTPITATTIAPMSSGLMPDFDCGAPEFGPAFDDELDDD